VGASVTPAPSRRMVLILASLSVLGVSDVPGTGEKAASQSIVKELKRMSESSVGTSRLIPMCAELICKFPGIQSFHIYRNQRVKLQPRVGHGGRESPATTSRRRATSAEILKRVSIHS